MSCEKEEHSTYDVRVLNGLIVSILDNVDEYRRAIFTIEQRLNTLQRRVYSRMVAVERLQRQVRGLGGQPASERSQLAAAFATILSNRALPVTDDDHVLRDAQRGEAALQRQFEACLGNCLVSAEVRQTASAALECITNQTIDAPQPGWVAPMSVCTTATPLSTEAMAN
jgi:uncharacterized protein (TIGR02284 family)